MFLTDLRVEGTDVDALSLCVQCKCCRGELLLLRCPCGANLWCWCTNALCCKPWAPCCTTGKIYLILFPLHKLVVVYPTKWLLVFSTAGRLQQSKHPEYNISLFSSLLICFFVISACLGTQWMLDATVFKMFFNIFHAPFQSAPVNMHCCRLRM